MTQHLLQIKYFAKAENQDLELSKARRLPIQKLNLSPFSLLPFGRLICALGAVQSEFYSFVLVTPVQPMAERYFGKGSEQGNAVKVR